MAIMDDRLKLYDNLKSQIGNTPLVNYQGEIPNGNTILIKRECDNPFGSHYDRVYLALFKHFEQAGKITPGDKVLETTSGSAGVSFAGIGALLGYDCYVALPASGEKAREEAIVNQLRDSNHLIFTPADTYVGGFPLFLKTFLAEHRDYFFLNHSMGSRDATTKVYTNNEVTLGALAEIADEVLAETVIDYFVPAVGNGSSVLGPGRQFKINNSSTKIAVYETFQSAVTYELKYPGEYNAKYGVTPGTLSRHKLPGTSFNGIDFPHIRNAIESGVIDDVALVSDEKMDAEYVKRTGRKDTLSLPHWDMNLENCLDLGRSSRAGIAVALQVAQNVIKKKMVVLGYDKMERYDH